MLHCDIFGVWLSGDLIRFVLGGKNNTWKFTSNYLGEAIMRGLVTSFAQVVCAHLVGPTGWTLSLSGNCPKYQGGVES